MPSGVTEITVEYRFGQHDDFDGFLDSGLTFLWPYFCGNLFPCKSAPADGLRFTVALTGLPADQIAVYPVEIPGDAQRLTGHSALRGRGRGWVVMS